MRDRAAHLQDIWEGVPSMQISTLKGFDLHKRFNTCLDLSSVLLKRLLHLLKVIHARQSWMFRGLHSEMVTVPFVIAQQGKLLTLGHVY